MNRFPAARTLLIFSILTLSLPFLPAPAGSSAAEVNMAPVRGWLARQASMKTLSAEFTQERHLRTLRNPLVSHGKLWVDEPEKFRWQIGDPPKTIAIRNGDELLILEPSKGRARKQSLEAGHAKDPGLDFIAGGFPRTLEELTSQFEVTSVEARGETYEATLKPLDRRLSLAVTRVVFLIEKDDFHLLGFELNFRDNSRVRTVFGRQVFNAKIDDAMFDADLSGYQVEDQTAE